MRVARLIVSGLIVFALAVHDLDVVPVAFRHALKLSSLAAAGTSPGGASTDPVLLAGDHVPAVSRRA